MLECWLKNKSEPIAILCDTFHKALKELKLNLAAKEFKENYPKNI